MSKRPWVDHPKHWKRVRAKRGGREVAAYVNVEDYDIMEREGSLLKLKKKR